MNLFSEKVNYMVAAMLQLARNYSKGTMRLIDIATEENIPKNYLVQLLIILQKAGLVASERGAKGGYKLLKPPNAIKITDIIESIEGELKFLEYFGKSPTLERFWQRSQEKLKQIFEITLEDLVNEEHEQNYII